MSRIKGWRIKKRYKDATVYESTPYSMMEILVAKLPINDRWNVDPNPAVFKERSFPTKSEAEDFARKQMKKLPNVGKG